MEPDWQIIIEGVQFANEAPVAAQRPVKLDIAHQGLLGTSPRMVGIGQLCQALLAA